MNKFYLYLDRKVTVWERESHAIEADNKEQAIEYMKTLAAYPDPNQTADTYSYLIREMLDETVEYLDPEENDNQSTLEVVDPEDKNSHIYSNQPPPVVKSSTDFTCPDGATMCMLTMYHSAANPKRSISVAEVDALLAIAAAFTKEYYDYERGNKNWEDSDVPWDSAIIAFYNANKPESFNPIS